jgi:hypothetical protein
MKGKARQSKAEAKQGKAKQEKEKAFATLLFYSGYFYTYLLRFC